MAFVGLRIGELFIAMIALYSNTRAAASHHARFVSFRRNWVAGSDKLARLTQATRSAGSLVTGNW